MFAVPVNSPQSEGLLSCSREPTACPQAEPEESSSLYSFYLASLDSQELCPMELDLSGLHAVARALNTRHYFEILYH